MTIYGNKIERYTIIEISYLSGRNPIALRKLFPSLLFLDQTIENELEFVVFYDLLGNGILVLFVRKHGGSIHRVHSYPEHIFNHIRDECLQKRRRELETWISVYLQQPRMELWIHHEIHPEKFKTVSVSEFIHQAIGSLWNLLSNIFHFVNQAFHSPVLLWKLLL